MNPPRLAYDAARARTFSATRAMRWGYVTYDDVVYECAVSLEGEGYEITDLGQKTTQRIKVSFAKADLPDRPRKGSTMLYEDMAFEIELVGGDMAGDPSWSVAGFRTRGADV